MTIDALRSAKITSLPTSHMPMPTRPADVATGIHVLRTRRIVTDVTQLLDEYGYSEAAELVAQKRSGESVVLNEPLRSKWRSQIERAFGALDDALVKSALPEEAPNRDELQHWLLAVRRGRWDRS